MIYDTHTHTHTDVYALSRSNLKNTTASTGRVHRDPLGVMRGSAPLPAGRGEEEEEEEEEFSQLKLLTRRPRERRAHKV
jgi:hypothetical protein